MKLNLSDDPITADLLSEALRQTGSATIAVNGNSMYPTLQMGWRVYLKPARGEDLRVGEIAVFRGDRYLTVHRLVWKETRPEGVRLVFRGDYNRLRERVDPAAVLARVAAVEIPGPRRGTERLLPVEADALTLFYRGAWLAFSIARRLLPAPRRAAPSDGGTPASGTGPAPPARAGRAARALFAGMERIVSWFLPSRR